MNRLVSLCAIGLAGAWGVAVAAPKAPAPAAEPTPPPVFLGGPEVVKLSWNTRALTATDLDGDKLTDLIVADNDRGVLWLLYQLKPGAPLPPSPPTLSQDRWEPVVENARFRKESLTTGVTVFNVVAGDFNGDGRVDLAYTSETTPLTLRLRKPDGGWTETKFTELPTPQANNDSLRAADLDGDGRTDLIMLGQKEIAILYQEPNGKFSPPDRLACAESDAVGLELADVEGDGRLSLVYMIAGDHEAVRVRVQKRPRQFGPEQSFPISAAASALRLLTPIASPRGATFVYAQSAVGQIGVVRLERSSAAPAPVAATPALSRPRVLSPRATGRGGLTYALGDFNGDHRLDLAVGDPDSAQVELYLRQKDGGFVAPQHFPSLAEIRSLAAGDWNGDGRDVLFVASAKEQVVAISTMQPDGRLGYPQALPLPGKPLALAAGPLVTGGPTNLAVVYEDKGKRFVGLWTRGADGKPVPGEMLELPSLKTDPKAIRLIDANQDGRADIAVFTPYESMRLYVQGEGGTFTEASANPAFRKGLVDNLDAGALTLGDVDGNGKPELIVAGTGFARALRLAPSGELQVVEQFNARDSTIELGAALVLPTAPGAKRPEVWLYDRKNGQLQALRADALGVYQTADSLPVGKLEVVQAEILPPAGGVPAEVFLLGRDRAWWSPLAAPELQVVPQKGHSTDLPGIDFNAVTVGDLNGDGRAEIVGIDTKANLIEVLSGSPETGWKSVLHFKVFETDRHAPQRKGGPMEPREALIADVTGDGRPDLVLLVHDRVLIYPQTDVP